MRRGGSPYNCFIRGLFVRRSRSTAGGRGHGGQYRDGDAGGDRGTARQTAGRRKEAERAARKAPQDAAADGTGEAGEPASRGFDRPEQSSSRSIRNRRPSVPGSSRAT